MMCAYGTDRQPPGAALVIVMLVMAVLLLAGTTFMTISSTESQIALNQRVSAQALLLAEGEIHKAIAQLNANSSYTGESVTGPGGETFMVTVTTAAAQPCGGTTAKDLVATATVPVRGGQAQVIVAATVDKISYPYRWAAFAAVPNQVVISPNQTIFGDDRTESELWLKDNSTTDSFDSSLGQYNVTTNRGTGGSIGGNGGVTLENTVNIQGSARAGDALHTGAGDVISGGQATSLSPTSTSPGEPFPSVSSPVNPPMSRPPTTIFDLPSPPSGSSYSVTGGSLNVTSGTLNLPAAGSPYYFTSMTFSNGTALTTSGGPVTIYATGAVTVGDSVTFGAASGTAEASASSSATQLRIVLKSDGVNWLDTANFTAGSNFRLYGSLYGKSTNIRLNDVAHVYGSIIGRTVVLHQNSAIHYDHAMLNQEICRSDNKYVIRRGTWREVIP